MDYTSAHLNLLAALEDLDLSSEEMEVEFLTDEEMEVDQEIKEMEVGPSRESSPIEPMEVDPQDFILLPLLLILLHFVILSG
jgi:hypothetical protein